MDVNPRLHEAVKVFRELGWDNASYDDVASLPVGDTAQQKMCADILEDGDWKTWERNDDGETVRTNHAGVDLHMLGL